MSESLPTTKKVETQSPRIFSGDDFPLQSDPESPDFEALSEDTALELVTRLMETPDEVESDNMDDDISPEDSKWRLRKSGSIDKGTVVLNLETWDVNPEQYFAGKKGPFRRTTIQWHPDGTFGYWGDADYSLQPMSERSGKALLGLMPEPSASE